MTSLYSCPGAVGVASSRLSDARPPRLQDAPGAPATSPRVLPKRRSTATLPRTGSTGSHAIVRSAPLSGTRTAPVIGLDSKKGNERRLAGVDRARRKVPLDRNPGRKPRAGKPGEIARKTWRRGGLPGRGNRTSHRRAAAAGPATAGPSGSSTASPPRRVNGRAGRPSGSRTGAWPDLSEGDPQPRHPDRACTSTAHAFQGSQPPTPRPWRRIRTIRT